MELDAKTIYAQSSDIKSRTYLQYRRDMKKKAVAELEVLEWLRGKVKEIFPEKQINVYKSGGDNFLWFLRKGGISRDPDFMAEINGQNVEIEFQYGDCDIQKDYIFDFKISKVGVKKKGQKKRVPKDTLFVYLFRGAPKKYAFLAAEWILTQGTEGTAPAWGNREVYKITGEQILTHVKEDSSLKQIWNNIDAKLFILNFQHELIDIIKDKLSHLLQTVIDENNIVKILPKDLDSFFKVCFILDNINKIPQNANLWLIYLLSYINKDLTLEEISKITYCVDFLYSKIVLKPNELTQLINRLKDLFSYINAFSKKDGLYQSSINFSLLDETRYALFSINLLEDLTQDMIFYYSLKELEPIKKIYENVRDVEKTYQLIKQAAE